MWSRKFRIEYRGNNSLRPTGRRRRRRRVRHIMRIYICVRARAGARDNKRGGRLGTKANHTDAHAQDYLNKLNSALVLFCCSLCKQNT